MFPNALSGGRLPVRSEVAHALSAGRKWAMSRDMPDPVGFADFHAQHDVFYEQLTERIRRGRFPVAVDRFPLPKPNGIRAMSWLDPYDDVGLRVLIGRATSAIRRACAGELLFSYPLQATGPGWVTLDYRSAQRQRQTRGLELLDDPDCMTLGVLDISDYYASIDVAILTEQLHRLGCPPGTVVALSLALAALPNLGGPPGIPIGFEGSGLLGNVYLSPADNLASAIRIGLVRYTDDSWIFLPRNVLWSEVRDEYVASIHPLGLQLNRDKAISFDKRSPDARSVIRHGALDSMTEGDQRRVSADEACDLLAHAAEERDLKALRFAIGVLTNEQDGRGLETLAACPDLFDEEPKKVGDYLVALARRPTTKRGIDRDWVLDVACRPVGSRTMAAQAHACRAAAELDLGKAHGERLLRFTHSAEARAYAPLQTWSAFAWTTSQHWKDGRALDSAREVGKLCVRRSFILGFKSRQPSRGAARHLREFERIEPDLLPTLRFVCK